MRKEVKTITKVLLEDNEQKCISDVASINCRDVECRDCPLYDCTTRVCIRTMARKICNENYVAYKWE